MVDRSPKHRYSKYRCPKYYELPLTDSSVIIIIIKYRYPGRENALRSGERND